MAQALPGRPWDEPWWRPAPPRVWWSVGKLEGLVKALSWLLGKRQVEVPLVGAPAVDWLDDVFAGRPSDRHDQLRSLWAAHARGASWAGVPPRLWARLLDRCGVEPAPRSRVWLDEPDPERLHPGCSLGRTTEWWGHPVAPGATYDDALWAWGMVAPTGRTPLAGRCSRDTWRYDDGWEVAPGLRAAVATRLDRPPRLEEGPGFLLACGIDAILELVRTQPITPRDRAVVWGTLILPIIAPSQAHATVPAARSVDVPPDYAQMLPFHLLHPRIQVAIEVFDWLVGMFEVNRDGLAEALTRLQGAAVGPGQVVEATRCVLEELHTQALARHAAGSWSSGFGFRMFRRMLRDLDPSDPERFARAFDDKVHGNARSSRELVGPLAERLRKGLRTALWYPGRPPYPQGPAADQLTDLVWARWTDPDFLRP